MFVYPFRRNVKIALRVVSGVVVIPMMVTSSSWA